MLRAREEGQPTGQLWRTFWVGGTLKEENEDRRSPHLTATPRALAPAMVRGVTLPWNLLPGSALGLWLLAAPVRNLPRQACRPCRLRVEKRSVQTGEVRIAQEVSEKRQTVLITLTQ